jgi:cytidine deaminase
MMKKIDLSISLFEYDSINELNEADRLLLEKAREAVQAAYAPYSEYYVGAAVLLENGEIYTGNNQENVAYPSGLCAERVAVFAAAANNPGIPVKAVAISARAGKFSVDNPVMPCGSCRQALAEYEMLYKNDIRVIMMGENGKVIVTESIRDILPLMFHAEELKKTR